MRRNSPHKKFWNREYQKPTHLAISTEPSEDLQKFTRWLERHYRGRILNLTTSILDLGCGNGRNSIWLSREFGVHGSGYDLSSEAVAQATRAAVGLPLTFAVRNLAEPLSLADESVDLVLDLMSSHVLKSAERLQLKQEIKRVLKSEGWFMFKSFLLEDDDHAKRLLRDHPADEEHSYLHPELGVQEHVWTIDEIVEFFGSDFEIHKIDKSHKHRSRGRAFRRRTVSVYLQKKT